MGHTQSTYRDILSLPPANLRFNNQVKTIQRESQEANQPRLCIIYSLFSVLRLLNLPNNLLVKGVLCTHTKMGSCISELCFDSLP